MPESKALFFDRQEVRSAAEREAAIFHALPGLVRHALDNAPGMACLLAGVDPDRITGRDALEALPRLELDALFAAQLAKPPFGGMVATPIGRLARVVCGQHGQLVPEGARVDYWRFARALFAAGVKRPDLVWNALPQDLGAFAAMVETGARALSCTVVPAGAVVDARALAALERLGPGVFVGEIRTLLAYGAALGRRCPFKKLILVGESPAEAELDAVRQLWGIAPFFIFATDEIGLIAYETEAHEGLIVDESLIVEVIDPASDRGAEGGGEGAVVVTAFNPDYPLLRLATGHRTRILPTESPCGRTNRRIVAPRPAGAGRKAA